MPTLIRFFAYSIYFWSNENKPLEPVHIHISKGKPVKNATKYWINSDGSIKQENNDSHIPPKDLQKLERLVKAYAKDIVKEWEKYFKQPATFHNKQSKNKEIER